MFSPRRRSLSRIIESTNRMIRELEELQAQHHADHQDLSGRIIALTAQRDNLLAERQQAEVIATNLRSLLGQEKAA